MTMLVTTGRVENMINLLGSIAVFAFVLGITYLVTRWIGSYQKTQSHNSNMHIIETKRIANNKYIQIIEIAETYLVIAVCKDSIVCLSKLDPKDIQKLRQIPNEGKAESFQDILKKLKGIKK